MYKNILIPVALDQEHDTQASFEAAHQLADADAVFTVVHVQEPIPAYVGSQIPSEVLAKLPEPSCDWFICPGTCKQHHC